VMTGVEIKVRQCAQKGELPSSAINVNDRVTKSKFDNGGDESNEGDEGELLFPRLSRELRVTKSKFRQCVRAHGS
jgi:hypothetical protein